MISALERPVHVTVFPDLAAVDRQSLFIPLIEFSELLRNERASEKALLRLFSLCSFGSKRTSKKSLRHDSNIRECYCVVGDYDGGQVSLADAAAALRQTGVCALLVTTPSYTPANPRWRVICPLSDPLRHDRANAAGFELAHYGRLVSRLAGIFPATLAAESWTRSQSWFLGGLAGAVDHGVMLIPEGACLDQLAALDGRARPKPTPPAKVRAPRGTRHWHETPIPDPQGDLLPDELLPLDVAACLEAIATGVGSHDAAVSLCGLWAAQDIPAVTQMALLRFAFDCRPPEGRDAGWRKARADIPRTVEWAQAKAAGPSAGALVAIPRAGNGTTPPPPPPPGAGASASAPPFPPHPQPQSASARGMMRSRNPKYAGNLANVATCLSQRPELVGCAAFDQMAMGVSLRHALPGAPVLFAPRPWSDDDTARLQEFLQRDCEMARVAKETVQQGVELVAREHGFHPTRDYLNGLTWDGIPRVDTWLIHYLGVEQSDYAKATGRMWLIGMVARIMRPGCKFDYMLILEGLQGTLKSQVCVALCGPWVSDQSLDIRHDARAASQHLRNKWLVEVSELTFFRQADVETLKAFITRTHEQYLPRYARNEVIEPRQCGFIGTTNQDEYLHDPTGNRRFWPHPTGKIDARGLLRDRGQLWAETVAAYHAGERWWPEAGFEARVIKPEQAARYDADGWTPLVETYLNGKTQVTLIEVFRQALADPYDALRGELPPEKFTRAAQIRVREILQNLGWKRGKLLHGYPQWQKPP